MKEMLVLKLLTRCNASTRLIFSQVSKEKIIMYYVMPNKLRNNTTKYRESITSEIILNRMIQERKV